MPRGIRTDRFTWKDGDLTQLPSGWNLTYTQPDSVHLVTTFNEFILHCTQNNLAPDATLSALAAAGTLNDAPAEFKQELLHMGLIKAAP